jgi:hypothetical protein
MIRSAAQSASCRPSFCVPELHFAGLQASNADCLLCISLHTAPVLIYVMLTPSLARAVMSNIKSGAAMACSNGGPAPSSPKGFIFKTARNFYTVATPATCLERAFGTDVTLVNVRFFVREEVPQLLPRLQRRPARRRHHGRMLHASSNVQERPGIGSVCVHSCPPSRPGW